MPALPYWEASHFKAASEVPGIPVYQRRKRAERKDLKEIDLMTFYWRELAVYRSHRLTATELVTRG